MHSNKHQLLAELIKQKVDLERLMLSDGKDDFTSQLSSMLVDDCVVESLGAANNLLAKITHTQTGLSVVLRTVTSYKHAMDEGVSSDDALNQLQVSPRFEKPYFREVVSESDFEVISFECSRYYANGDLAHYFQRLRNDVDPSTFIDEVRKQTRQLLFMLSYLRKKGVWHTDLKPSNIMLDESHDLAFSDNKGLLPWQDSSIRSNRTETTLSYYDDSVFSGNTIDLGRLMRLNLAASIYEMITGTLPEKDFCSLAQTSLLRFDLDQDIFLHGEGRRMSTFITALSDDDSLDLKQWIKQLSKPCWKPSMSKKHCTFFAVSEQRRVNPSEYSKNHNESIHIQKQ